MLKRLWEHFAPANRAEQIRSDLAGRLLDHLDRHGSLVLDERAFREFGAGRERVFRVVCDLAMRERVHLRADAEKLVAMSNREFSSLLWQRAALGHKNGNRLPGSVIATEFRKEAVEDDSMTVMAVSPDMMAEHPGIASTPSPAAELPAVAEPPSPPPEETVTQEHTIPEPPWFTLEIAPSAPEAENTDADTPADRNILPERKREPWLVVEETWQED